MTPGDILTDGSLRAEVSLDPTASVVPFGQGEVRIGTITATGAGVTDIQIMSDAPFSILTDCDDLQMGVSCQFELIFTSPGEGTFAGDVVITFFSEGTPYAIRIPVSATGTSIMRDVLPVFPINGAGWNDYVNNPTLEIGPGGGEDQPCVIAPGGPYRCLHGGERRSVLLPATATCDGLAATDGLGAFNWACHEGPSGVSMVSIGLKAAAGLGDLLDVGGFINNSVTITNEGAVAVRTLPSSWWSTPVVPLPISVGSMVSLTTPRTLYVGNTSQPTGGHSIEADGIGVVLLPGVTLTFADTGVDTCNSADGTLVAPDRRCLLTVSAREHLWIEGRWESQTGPADNYGMIMASVNASVFRRLEIQNTGNVALDLQGARNNLLHRVFQSRNSNGRGIGISGDFNRLVEVHVADNFSEGLRVEGRQQIILESTASNNGGIGFYLGCGAARTTVVSALFANNGGRGIWNVCAGGNTLSHMTAAQNGSHGIHVDQTADNTVFQALSVNNQGDGYRMDFGAQRNLVSQLASLRNEGSGVFLDATDGTFRDSLILGNNSAGPCTVVGRTAPGLLTDTCSDTGTEAPSTYTGQSSTADLRPGRDSLGLFLGRVTVDDPANPDDLAGQAATVIDWFRFRSPLRVWGNDSLGFPDPAGRGRCTSNCRIWDWSFFENGPAVWNNSAAGSGSNQEFGPDCPDAVHGDRVLSDLIALELIDGVGNDDGVCDSGEACAAPNTFLINATEIRDDGEGDDDGLCESNERCLYSPHFGRYQGHNSPSPDTCGFTDGQVAGVRMFVRGELGY